MSPVPTESRIFADRYFRELRRLEKQHAVAIAPGAATWHDALLALYARMRRTGSPTKQAAVLGKAISYLRSVKPEDIAHIVFDYGMASRSAALCFATFKADLHPLKGVDEDGIGILWHVLKCDRRGAADLIEGIDLAYISRHAVARLHERDYDTTHGSATGLFGCAAVLGYITRLSAKHFRGELCLHFGSTLLVGSLKHTAKPINDDEAINGTFYDVRTALPADEVNNQDMLEQGRIAAHVVAQWFDHPTPDVAAMAEQIPFLPRRADDHTLRSVARH